MVLVALVVLTVVGGVSGQAHQIDTSGFPISALAWSPAGDLIATGVRYNSCEFNGSDAYNVRIIDASTGEVVQILFGFSCTVTGLGWTKDARQLAASSLDAYGMRVWEVETGEVLAEIQTGSQGLGSIKWSTDETYLAVAFYFSNEVAFLDPKTGKLASSVLSAGTIIDWKPNSLLLASGGEYMNSILITDLEVDSITELSGDFDHVTDLSWHPSGDRLAASSNSQIQILDRQYDLSMTIHINTTSITKIDWNPDGTMLASASEDGTVRVWDAESGELIGTFTYTGPVYALDWSPDGTKIAFGGADVRGESPEVVIVDAPELPKIEATLTP
jgi:WD40 repeat protein